MKEGHLKRGKRKPEGESLHNYSVHQKVMGWIKVNYSGEVTDTYRLDDDVVLFSGAG
jgi:hypothetical protein